MGIFPDIYLRHPIFLSIFMINTELKKYYKKRPNNLTTLFANNKAVYDIIMFSIRSLMFEPSADQLLTLNILKKNIP